MAHCFFCEKEKNDVIKRKDYQGNFAGKMCSDCWAGSGLNPEAKPKPIFLKFKENIEEGDATAVMRLLEFRGDRVLVEHQTGDFLQQQSVYLITDLEEIK